MDSLQLELAQKVLDLSVITILGVMSVVALWLFIERLIYYKHIDTSSYNDSDLLELDLSDNLSTISTIGANAPFIGLLGTVLGIMTTFFALGESGSVNTAQVMMGLASALKATGFGIAVAIPAIIFYTILLRKMQRLLTLFEVEKKDASV